MTHPKYGQRYACYQCGVKFFDLFKPKPICPKCGADQKKAPKKASKVKSVVVDDYEDSPEEDPIDVEIDDFSIKSEREARFNPDHDHISIEDMPEDEL